MYMSFDYAKGILTFVSRNLDYIIFYGFVFSRYNVRGNDRNLLRWGYYIWFKQEITIKDKYYFSLV